MFTKERGIGLIALGAIGLAAVAGGGIHPLVGLLVLSIEAMAGGITILMETCD